MTESSQKSQPVKNRIKEAPICEQRCSNAIRGWLTIVVLVLLLLWVETRRLSSSNYNLFLNGDSVAVGARVLLDGKLVGEMSASGGEGLGGSVFYGHAENGYHKIEVKKAGYEPFVTNLDMSGEDYLSVKLEATSK